jgi:hypothetical protein
MESSRVAHIQKIVSLICSFPPTAATKTCWTEVFDFRQREICPEKFPPISLGVKTSGFGSRRRPFTPRMLLHGALMNRNAGGFRIKQ